VTSTNPILTKPTDGPVSRYSNRPVSRLVSALLAQVGVSPNGASYLSGAVGLLGALAFGRSRWRLGALMVHTSSILAGVDGEIARRTGRSSQFGDFLDTVLDRVVEYAALLGLIHGASRSSERDPRFGGVLALGGVFLLTTASEKYRSTVHAGYPKRRLEPAFAYLTSGRDVRLFWTALAAVAAASHPRSMYWFLWSFATLTHANAIIRLQAVRRTLGQEQN